MVLDYTPFCATELHTAHPAYGLLLAAKSVNEETTRCMFEARDMAHPFCAHAMTPMQDFQSILSWSISSAYTHCYTICAGGKGHAVAGIRCWAPPVPHGPGIATCYSSCPVGILQVPSYQVFDKAQAHLGVGQGTEAGGLQQAWLSRWAVTCKSAPSQSLPFLDVCCMLFQGLQAPVLLSTQMPTGHGSLGFAEK